MQEQEIQMQQEAYESGSGAHAVKSVNGYTGVVVLTTSDLENTSDYQTGEEVESSISAAVAIETTNRENADSALETAIGGKQNTLTAGANITISGDTISATDTTYTAGNNIQINDGVISATDTTYTAGANVQINNGVISATDTTYTAGNGLNLSSGAFSVDTSVVATKASLDNEIEARQNTDNGLQGQIDALAAASDVTDVVGTKADLNAYDTTTLNNNDIIKVLQDESQNEETTYYRWSTTTHTFTLIGEEGPYYTKSAVNALLDNKQNTLTAGSNISISGDTISATDTTYTAGTNVQINNGVISATDTTYTAGTGLTLTGTEFTADTTVLATQTALTGVSNRLGGLTLLTISQNDYNNLSTKDPNTLYIITGA